MFILVYGKFFVLSKIRNELSVLTGNPIDTVI